MGAMRRLRVLVALAVAGLAPALTAAPAHAHGLGGEEPTNVRTRLVAVEPPAAGVEVDLVGLGRSVELRVARGHEVVVLGYEGEPYLWVTPDGVLRNARSPATYQNRTLSAPAGVPARYDASAPPEWERIADGTTVRWHDHRAHYMGTGAFAGVRTFTIPMRVDGRDVSVRGEMRWVEPPPWWPWPLLAAALALAVVLVARASYRVGAVLALTALVAGEAVHVAGSWQAAGASLPARAGSQALSVAAVALGAFALARVRRGGAETVAPWALVAAVALVVTGGLGDVAAWYRSQLPSDLAPGLVRVLVAVAFGAGAGLIVASAPRVAPVAGAADAGRGPGAAGPGGDANVPRPVTRPSPTAAAPRSPRA